jgi:hypothetical protein
MKRHMKCDIVCQVITLPNHPFGKDDKFITDTYSGLYEITYKIRPSVRIICNKV